MESSRLSPPTFFHTHHTTVTIEIQGVETLAVRMYQLSLILYRKCGKRIEMHFVRDFSVKMYGTGVQRFHSGGMLWSPSFYMQQYGITFFTVRSSLGFSARI